MFTETRSSLARVRLKEQLDGLQSFEPDDRSRAGRELVTADLARSAGPLLDHVANEFDDRVLTAIASAVVDTPPAPRESRRVRQLREWAASELERLALEEAFLGHEPEPVGRAFDFAPVAAPYAEPERPQLAVRQVASTPAAPTPAPTPVAPTPVAPKPVAPMPVAPNVLPETAEPTGIRHISWRAPEHDLPPAGHPRDSWAQRR